MKIKKIIIVILTVISGFSLMCFYNSKKGELLSANTNNIISRKITMKDLQLGKLKIDMTIKEVLKIMQRKPIKLTSNKGKQQKGEPLFETLEYYDGTIIDFVDNQVSSITVVNNKYPTPRGLKVGDSLLRLINLYGKYPYKEANEITYYFEENEDYDAIHVKILNDKIIQIVVHYSFF